MGKYSGFKSQLTKFTVEGDYQDRVNKEKERIETIFKEDGKSGSIRDFAEILLAARIEKARLEALEKKENLTIEAMVQTLVGLLEDQTLTQVKLDGGVSMTIKDDVYCSLSDKQAFHAWIAETDQEDLLTVNYMTMSSLVKKRMIGEVSVEEGGSEIPPGIDVYFKQGITVRGAKNLGTED